MINEFPIGLLSEEEKQYAISALGGYVKTLGEKIYHLGNGTLTGEAGWVAFNKELRKYVENNWKNKK